MKTKTILIIDDEAEFAEMLQMRLQAVGYTVDLAFNGEQGLEKAQTGEPQIILLDVMMPGINGFEVLRRLRKNPKTWPIPVVMLTARGEFKSITEAQAAGAADYLIKPCETEELLKLIRRYIK